MPRKIAIAASTPNVRGRVGRAQGHLRRHPHREPDHNWLARSPTPRFAARTGTRLYEREMKMRVANMTQAVEAHACGEPGRVIVGGVLDVPGATMFDKMCHVQ